MKKAPLGILIVILAIVPCLTGCGEKWDRFWGGYYLEGDWTVTEFDPSGQVLDTHLIAIEQTASSLEFFRDGRRLGYGRIFDDYIASDDLHGYGIDKIYIDSDDHMTSEVVDHDTVGYLVFERVPD